MNPCNSNIYQTKTKMGGIKIKTHQMKNYISPICIIVPALCLFCMGTLSFQATNVTGATPITGNFTRAGKPVSLILKTPKMNSTETGCDGGCLTQIEFSDPTIPVITVKDCIGGELANLGDLNGDGLDEIGLLPGWFAGCWHNYRVYTFKHKQWQLAVPPFPTHCNEFETAGVKLIVKDAAKPGHVLVTYSMFENGNIVFKTKSEPVE